MDHRQIAARRGAQRHQHPEEVRVLLL